MTEAATLAAPLKDESSVTTVHLIGVGDDDSSVLLQTESDHHENVAATAAAVTRTTRTTTHFLEELPLHLLRHILCQLPTVRALASAALAHRSFYEAYHDDPLGIMAAILDAQIPSADLRAYCAAACLAKTVDCTKADTITAFLAEHISRTTSTAAATSSSSTTAATTTTTTMTTTTTTTAKGCDSTRRSLMGHGFPQPAERFLVAMSDLHVVVEYFARAFLRDVAEPAHHIFGAASFARPPSENEIVRIQRALYMFHVYCVLFSAASRSGRIGFGFSLMLLREELFGAFSPWGREQIVSIFEYMERVARRGMKHVKTENLGWDGHMRASMTPVVPNEAGEAFLSKGLESFYALDRAPDEVARSHILFPAGVDTITTTTTNDNNESLASPTTQLIRFPSVYLELASGAYYHLSVSLRSKELEQWHTAELHALEKPATDGVDGFLSPPFTMWSRAHRRYVVGVSVRLPRYKVLRRAGYVFWDATPFLLGSDADIQARFATAVYWREQAVARGAHLMYEEEGDEEVLDGWWPEDLEMKTAAMEWAGSGYGARQ